MPTGYEVIIAIEQQYNEDPVISQIFEDLFDVIHGPQSSDYGEEVNQESDNTEKPMKFQI